MENTNTNNINMFGIVILFIVLSVGVLSFIFKVPFSNNNAEMIEKSKNISIQNISTVEKSRAAVESKVFYLRNDLESKTPAKLTDLDRELSIFIPTLSESVLVSRETYKNKTKGWNITYFLNKNLIESYTDLLKLARTSPYEIFGASRASMSSIIVTESKKYSVKIVVDVQSDKSTIVNIIVQDFI